MVHIWTRSDRIRSLADFLWPSCVRRSFEPLFRLSRGGVMKTPTDFPWGDQTVFPQSANVGRSTWPKQTRVYLNCAYMTSFSTMVQYTTIIYRALHTHKDTPERLKSKSTTLQFIYLLFNSSIFGIYVENLQKPLLYSIKGWRLEGVGIQGGGSWSIFLHILDIHI